MQILISDGSHLSSESLWITWPLPFGRSADSVWVDESRDLESVNVAFHNGKTQKFFQSKNGILYNSPFDFWSLTSQTEELGALPMLPSKTIKMPYMTKSLVLQHNVPPRTC